VDGGPAGLSEARIIEAALRVIRQDGVNGWCTAARRVMRGGTTGDARRHDG